MWNRIIQFICIGGLMGGSTLAAWGQSAASDTVCSKPVHRIGVDFRPSYVFPTHSFFEGNNAKGTPVSTQLSAHLRYSFQFAPDSRYRQLYPYAYQGIGVAYNTFPQTSEMGSPVAVYVFQGSRIARLSSRLSLDYEWNFGASFGWKKFNPETNPYNDVVGSAINAYISAGFLLNWQLAPRWKLVAGVDFTHYSNGNTHYPNSGVNTVGGRIGVARSLGQATGEERVKERWDALPLRRRFCLDIVAYGSTRKRGIMWDEENGDLLPGNFGVVGFNVNPMFIVNKYFRAGISVDGQYDESANLREYRVEGTGGEEIKFYHPPFREQVAVGVSLRAELNMPIFSVNVGVGRNLCYTGEDTEGWYQVLALKTFVTRHLFLHVGYQLSNFKDPNNLMLGIGCRLGR